MEEPEETEASVTAKTMAEDLIAMRKELEINAMDLIRAKAQCESSDHALADIRDRILEWTEKHHPRLFDRWLGPTVGSEKEIIGLLEEVLAVWGQWMLFSKSGDAYIKELEKWAFSTTHLSQPIESLRARYAKLRGEFILEDLQCLP